MNKSGEEKKVKRIFWAEGTVYTVYTVFPDQGSNKGLDA